MVDSMVMAIVVRGAAPVLAFPLMGKGLYAVLALITRL